MNKKPEKGTVLIYGLVCPLTSEIKYVGRTVQSLNRRLSMHRTVNKHKCNKDKWHDSLLKLNLFPSIKLLHVSNTTDWRIDEKLWIEKLSSNGLLNEATGGGGGIGIKINYCDLFVNYLVDNKSGSTIKNYKSVIHRFLLNFNRLYKNPKDISTIKICEYLNRIENKNTRKTTMSCIKLFYNVIINQPKKFKNVEYDYS
ncbi:MAG: phage integrase N-terminal SAM-like domain-containing protein [Paludibacter sp.]|nr:phage integrase N-terminal SAM-like domain-containing protein [Paludibacter sp.]